MYTTNEIDEFKLKILELTREKCLAFRNCDRMKLNDIVDESEGSLLLLIEEFPYSANIVEIFKTLSELNKGIYFICDSWINYCSRGHVFLNGETICEYGWYDSDHFEFKYKGYNFNQDNITVNGPGEIITNENEIELIKDLIRKNEEISGEIDKAVIFID